MKNMDKLLAIARRKYIFDQTNSWYDGSATYLTAIPKEIDEVIEEIPKSRACYLEDELADVLWNYLNAVIALEKEAEINLASILERACTKYGERVSSIESGELWSNIKSRQKLALENEHQANKNT